MDCVRFEGQKVLDDFLDLSAVLFVGVSLVGIEETLVENNTLRFCVG